MMISGNLVLELIQKVNLMSEEILDGKSTIELNLDKELLFDLMLMAHERDITLNQLIEEALRLFIEEQEKKE